jgi:hypothetical protein
LLSLLQPDPRDKGGKAAVAVEFELCLVGGKYAVVRRDRQIEDVDAELQRRAAKQAPQILPIRLTEGRKATIRLNRTTALCMCHDRFAMRVYNDQDEYVWENQTDLRGTCHLLAADLNQDGQDEIVVYQGDHGHSELLVFRNQLYWPGLGALSPVECVRRVRDRWQRMSRRLDEANVRCVGEASMLGFREEGDSRQLPDAQSIPDIMARLAAAEQVVDVLAAGEPVELTEVRWVVNRGVASSPATRVVLLELTIAGLAERLGKFVATMNAQCRDVLSARATNSIPADGAAPEEAQVWTVEVLFAAAGQADPTAPPGR